MLADEICRRIEGAELFSVAPHPLHDSGRDLWRRQPQSLGAGRLPPRNRSANCLEAHIAFLDEIFKANSSILNAILTLINERLFHNGKEVSAGSFARPCFGASNELPEEEELTALYDRFLVRFVVNYIAEDFRFLRMLESRSQATRTSLRLSELRELQEQVRRYCHPVPRIPKYRRHSARAQQKKHPSVGPPLSTITVITPGSRLPGRRNKKYSKRTCSSWNMFCGVIRGARARFAVPSASYCSATKRRLPSCSTSPRDPRFRLPFLGDQRRTGPGADRVSHQTA